MRGATYDTKCFDLAEAFLSDEPTIDTPEYRARLAVQIQLTIEEWIGHELRIKK